MNKKDFANKLLQVAFGMGAEMPAEKVEPKKVKLEEARLNDGETVIATPAEEFAEGVEVFVIADGEQMPLGPGTYGLDDGRELVVETEGIVATVTAAETEEADEEELSKEAAPALTREDVQGMIADAVKELNFDSQKTAMEKQSETIEALLSQVGELLNQPAAGSESKHKPEASKEKAPRKPVTEMSRMERLEHYKSLYNKQ